MTDPKRIAKGLYWDRSWKLIDGCTPVSSGCAHCWSARETHRMEGNPNAKVSGPKKGLTDGIAFNGKIQLRWENLDLPLRTKKPAAWALWNDLFHEGVSDDFIFHALAIMALAEKHFFFVLTKRSSRMREFFQQEFVWALIEGQAQKIYHDRTGENPDEWLAVHELPNVIGMVTAENQEMADLRIPDLLATPWTIRGVSVEPMLGALDLTNITYKGALKNVAPGTDLPFGVKINALTGDFHDGWDSGREAKLNWVICGCESGQQRRKTKIGWIRNLKNLCVAAGVPFFLKQSNGYVCGRSMVVKMPEMDGRTWDDLPGY